MESCYCTRLHSLFFYGISLVVPEAAHPAKDGGVVL